MLMFGLAQTSHFGLWDIIPSESQLAFHIYYVNYENTRKKGLVGTWGGGGGGGGGGGWGGGNDVLKIFFYFLYVTILAPK